MYNDAFQIMLVTTNMCLFSLIITLNQFLLWLLFGLSIFWLVLLLILLLKKTYILEVWWWQTICRKLTLLILPSDGFLVLGPQIHFHPPLSKTNLYILSMDIYMHIYVYVYIYTIYIYIYIYVYEYSGNKLPIFSLRFVFVARGAEAQFEIGIFSDH